MSLHHTISHLINQPPHPRDSSWTSSLVANRKVRAISGRCARSSPGSISPFDPSAGILSGVPPLWTHGRDLAAVTERCIILAERSCLPGVTPNGMETCAVFVPVGGGAGGAMFLHSACSAHIALTQSAAQRHALPNASTDAQHDDQLWYLTADPSAMIQIQLMSDCARRSRSDAHVLASLQSARPAVCALYKCATRSSDPGGRLWTYTFEGSETPDIKSMVGRSDGEAFLLLLSKGQEGGLGAGTEMLNYTAFFTPTLYPNEHPSIGHPGKLGKQVSVTTRSASSSTRLSETLHINNRRAYGLYSVAHLPPGPCSLSSGQTRGYADKHSVHNTNPYTGLRSSAKPVTILTRTRSHLESIEPDWYRQAWAMHALEPQHTVLKDITPEGYRTLALLTPTLGGSKGGALQQGVAFLHQKAGNSSDQQAEYGSDNITTDDNQESWRLDVRPECILVKPYRNPYLAGGRQIVSTLPPSTFATMLEGAPDHCRRVDLTLLPSPGVPEIYLESISAHQVEVYGNSAKDRLLCINPEKAQGECALHYVQMQLQQTE